MITLTPGKYRSLTLLAGKNNRFSMLAIDQRPPIQGLIAEKKGDSHASDADVSAVKRVLLESLQRCADSVLADHGASCLTNKSYNMVEFLKFIAFCIFRIKLDY